MLRVRGRGHAAFTLAAIVVLVLSACSSSTRRATTDGGTGSVAGATPSPTPADDAADTTASPTPDGGEVDAGASPTSGDDGTGTDGDDAQDGTGGDPDPDDGGTTGQAPTEAPSSPSDAPDQASGRGFTSEEIYVGYATSKSASDAMAAFGISLATGDQEAQLGAIVDDLNAKGGIGGRRIVPVVYDFDASSIQNPEPAAQAACAHWTQDNEVFAVVNIWALGGGDDTLNSCLAKRQTPLVSMSPQLRPDVSYSTYAPYVIGPANVAMERFVRRWLRRAADVGYFEGWDTSSGEPGDAPTIAGILVNESLYPDAFDQAVREVLQQLDVTVASTFRYSGEVSSNSSEMNNAVLRFKSEGVTHVITSAGMEPFAQAAENQSYRPRYVMSSFHNPAFAQTIVPNQLRGAVGAGLIPALDVDTQRDPGPISPADAHCREIMEEAGEDTSSRQALSLMLTACDGFNFLKGATEAGSFSPSGVAAGAEAMGSMISASTFASTFPDGRLTGASALRDFIFKEDCSCFTYVDSTNHPM